MQLPSTNQNWGPPRIHLGSFIVFTVYKWFTPIQWFDKLFVCRWYYDASEEEYGGLMVIFICMDISVIFLSSIALDLGHKRLALDWNLQHGIRGGGLGRLFCFFLFLFIQLYCFVITKKMFHCRKKCLFAFVFVGWIQKIVLVLSWLCTDSYCTNFV